MKLIHSRPFVVGALIAALGAPAWTEDGNDTYAGKDDVRRRERPPSPIQVDEIAESPQNYVGREVWVQAEVDDVINSHVFTLDEDRRGAGPDVVVIVPDPSAGVTENLRVTVMGTVRPMSEVRDEYPFLDGLTLTPADRPVIVAYSVIGPSMAELAGGSRPWVVARLPLESTDVAAREPEPMSTLFVSADRIAADPKAYYGRRVEIRRAEVEDVISSRVFTLDEDVFGGGPDVAVIVPRLARRNVTVMKGSKVTVVGTVRRYVRTDMERDFDWLGDEPDLFVRIHERPVVVAESVRGPNGRELVAP